MSTFSSHAACYHTNCDGSVPLVVNRNAAQEPDPDNVPPHFTPAEWEMHCNGYWRALRDIGLHVPGGEHCGDTTDGAGNCVTVVDGPDGRFVGGRCACHCHREE